jgi:hypothetical protein
MEISVGKNRDTLQFDEQLRLIQADDREEALHKAVQIGRKEEECFRNIKGELVRWIFRGVTHIHLMKQELYDGAELFSSTGEYPSDTTPQFNFLTGD